MTPDPSRVAVVITTIHPPSATVHRHCERSDALGYRVIIVGDRKTPNAAYRDLAERHAGVDFLDLERQRSLFPDLSGELPVDHYARKSLGYLRALRAGCTTIVDTDDDNFPYDSFEAPARSLGDGALLAIGDDRSATAFYNVYQAFTRAEIWPRGFPLQCLAGPNRVRLEPTSLGAHRVAIWQALADGDPDVDAIFRLTRIKQLDGFTFDPGPVRVVCDVGVLAPINSQNTWWVDPMVFPFLYLPATVSPRVADILRGYVAQHCSWRQGAKLGFVGATARQDRNPHDLMADFQAELPLYSDVLGWNRVLSQTPAGAAGLELLSGAYRGLVAAGLIPHAELACVDAWRSELQRSPGNVR